MHIWIPKIDPRKRREVEKVVEHVVETATKSIRSERAKMATSLSEVRYMDEKKMGEMALKAQRDEYGKVTIKKGEGGQIYLKAGDHEIELRRKKFLVADLLTGEKKAI
jgi:ribosome recycling factor